ncbi:MAG: hypothetical protein JEZ08_02215 [Clostridiales bacterium]|nr:hypothetical protein [Clostridiales bacterium]
MDNLNTLSGDDVIEYVKTKNLEIKDEDFIREKLMMDHKGKIKLAGFLYYVLLVLCLNFSRNVIEFTQIYSLYNMVGIVIIMSLLISQALGLYALFTRHKMARWIMIGQYVILIIISLLSFNVYSIGFVLNSTLMILYFLISKRVKYTFIS